MARLPRKKTEVELIKTVFELNSDSDGSMKIENKPTDYPYTIITLSFEVEKNNENFELIRKYLNNKKEK